MPIILVKIQIFVNCINIFVRFHDIKHFTVTGYIFVYVLCVWDRTLSVRTVTDCSVIETERDTCEGSIQRRPKKAVVHIGKMASLLALEGISGHADV